MSKKVILIGGTPGVGKSSVATFLARHMQGIVLDLGVLAAKEGLIIGDDFQRQTKIVDPQKLLQWLSLWLRDRDGWIILESHFIEIVKLPCVRLVLIIRAKPAVLKARLLKRGWNIRKINENVQAEILGVCAGDARKTFKDVPVIEIDSSLSTPKDIAYEITGLLNSSSKTLKERAKIKFDWLSQLGSEELEAFFTEPGPTA
ncbi:MAG: adenylate kinase family protein [Candidatus Ranarchaeia archaeon]